MKRTNSATLCLTHTPTHGYTVYLHTVLLTQPPAVDAKRSHGVMRAPDGGHPPSMSGGARQGVFDGCTAAATEVLVEPLLEGFAHQVQCERIQAGIGEGQDSSDDAAHKMSHGSVHLSEGSVQEKLNENLGHFAGYANAL